MTTVNKNQINIALDKDNNKTDWRNDKSISYAIESLEKQAKTVNCIQPKSLNSEKTDYNDLARAGRGSEICKDVNDNLPEIDGHDVLSVEKSLDI